MRLKLMFVAALSAAALSGFTLSAQEVKSQWDGIYTAEQATRGQAVYGEKCAYCHGKTLAGYMDPDNPAPALTGENFTANWHNEPISGLFDKIALTMPQDEPGALKPEQTADVVAFILSFGKYPAGATPLSSKSDDLKAFKFLTKK